MTKRVRVARAMAMATKVVGKEESDGKGGRSNGDGSQCGGQATKREW